MGILTGLRGGIEQDRQFRRARFKLQPARTLESGMAEILRLQDRMDEEHIGGSSERLLEEALRAREKLLREHPHLQAYQDEIDRIMGKVIGFDDRMAVLGVMMEAKIYELRDSVLELRSMVQKVESVLDAEKESIGKLLS